MAKSRSPNYPSVGLSEAIALAQQLWKREKRTSVPQDVAVKAWGYSSLSGVARSKLAALRQYNLVEDAKDGVALSRLALEIIHQPEGSEEQTQALKDAALSVDLFRELARTHSDASPDNLKAYLITRKGFSDIGADKLIAAFRDTIHVAGLDVSGYSGEDAWTKVEASSEDDEMNGQPVASLHIRGRPKGGKVFLYQLSPQISAEVRFTGESEKEELQPRHIDLLAAYLRIAKDALKEESESEE